VVAVDFEQAFSVFSEGKGYEQLEGILLHMVRLAYYAGFIAGVGPAGQDSGE
jgi:hypothetical protein